MRLYLSSLRMGNRPEQLRDLARSSRRAAVIANAMDGDSANARQAGVERELAALSALGFHAEELDLRDYFARPKAIEPDLAPYGLVWLRGANVFMLRHALHRAGADAALGRLLRNDALVYGAYSAGPCVLGPTIRGFDLDRNGASSTSWSCPTSSRRSTPCRLGSPSSQPIFKPPACPIADCATARP